MGKHSITPCLAKGSCSQREADFTKRYIELTRDLNIKGNLVPDAHIATILQQHGVDQIYTADSDFRKFAFLKVINPLE